jgi:uncharacterized membrane protein
MNGKQRSNGAVMQMLQTHPQQAWMDPSRLAEAIETLNRCATTCTACADACLGEQHVQDLTRCIRLNLDCADICQTTSRTLTRQVQPEQNVLRMLLDTCANICRSCGQECESHAQMHEHCRVCAEACRQCEQICSELMGNVQRR